MLESADTDVGTAIRGRHRNGQPVGGRGLEAKIGVLADRHRPPVSSSPSRSSRRVPAHPDSVPSKSRGGSRPHPRQHDSGRDVLSRAIRCGASLLIAVGSVMVGSWIGGPRFDRRFQGRHRHRAQRPLQHLLAFPQLVLALTLVSVLAQHMGREAGDWAHRTASSFWGGHCHHPCARRITPARRTQREFVWRRGKAPPTSASCSEVPLNVIPAMLSIVARRGGRVGLKVRSQCWRVSKSPIRRGGT